MILQIWSSGYCGSSILNLLLDSVIDVRGLGEINSAGTKLQTCYQCINNCTFYDGIKKEELFDIIQEKYGCVWMIDTSKNVAHYQQYPHAKKLVLYKFPHEHADSCQNHHNWTVEQSFINWIDNYDLIRRNIGDEWLTMAYKNLSPIKICNWLGISAKQKRQNWWQTDTHILGGNTSVLCQTRQEFRVDHTHPKYQKWEVVFLDDYWRKDNQLKKDCRAVYRNYQNKLKPIIEELGMKSMSEMQADLDGPTTIEQFNFVWPFRTLN